MREFRSALAAGCVLALNIAWWAAAELYPALGESVAPWVFPTGLVVAAVLAWFWFRSVQPAQPSEYMSAYEALRYIAYETEWARKQRTVIVAGETSFGAMPMRKNVPLEAIGEFSSQAQRLGTRIRVFGRRLVPNESVEIPHTFWMTNTIDAECAFNASQPSRTAASSPRSEPPYADLRIERAGVLATWPRPNLWRRVAQAFPGLAVRLKPKTHAADF